MIRKALKRLLGEGVIGGIEYFVRPHLRAYRGGAFNDQHFRQSIFNELIDCITFSRIYETGTFRGTTTKYMADTSRLPVYTVEALPRNYGFSKARFLFNRKVLTHLGDSREFLKQHIQHHDNLAKPIFVYLDAHWQEDLPLLEECQIILEHPHPCVIMIDDFAVPYDPGYGYDDYGPGKCLNMEYLQPLSSLHHGLLFPALPSHQESGARRGCTLLSNNAELSNRLHGMATLRTVSIHSPMRESASTASLAPHLQAKGSGPQ